MKVNLYCIFDVVADSVAVVGTGNTDGMFIRQNVPYLEKLNSNYLNDFRVYQIATLAESSMTVESLPAPRLVSWDSYKRPEVDSPMSISTQK